MKERIHTSMIGRRVQINSAEQFGNFGPQARYFKRSGQHGEIVNVYLKDGEPAYDVMFADGSVEDGLYSFGFTVTNPGA